MLDSKTLSAIEQNRRWLAQWHPPPASAPQLISQLGESLGSLAARLGEGASAPLRLALFGPTGGGKSKIFSSLIHEDVSASGFRRPFTMEPVCYVHDSWPAGALELPGAVRHHQQSFWRSIVLIDTPDFDSVEAQNLAAAERVLGAADSILFVTDTQKYGDQSTWEYLGRILSDRKPVFVVINKVTDDGPAGDFFDRVRERALGDVVMGSASIRLYPIDDAAGIPEDDPGLTAVREAIHELAGSPKKRLEVRAAAFSQEFDHALSRWRALSKSLGEYSDGLDQLSAELKERYARGADSLEREFEASLDPGVRDEVYGRVLERLEKVDPFRYPRKLLALPFEGAKSLYRRFRPAEPAPTTSPEEETLERLDSYRTLEGLLLRLSEETRRGFAAEKRCPQLISTEEFVTLPFSHEELLERYRSGMVAYKEWLRRESTEAAESVTHEHRAKFLISQLIYNSGGGWRPDSHRWRVHRC